MNLGDADGDGQISLDEFLALMSPCAAEVIAKVNFD